MTSCYQILVKHTIIDTFCSKWTSYRISHIRIRLWCDIATKNPFSQNKSTIVYISTTKMYINTCGIVTNS